MNDHDEFNENKINHDVFEQKIDNSNWRIQNNYEKQIHEYKKCLNCKLLKWKNEKLTKMRFWLKKCKYIWMSHNVYICK